MNEPIPDELPEPPANALIMKIKITPIDDDAPTIKDADPDPSDSSHE